jgi:hypothetical protein
MSRGELAKQLAEDADAVGRARAWPRMPPVIYGWEAAHAAAAGPVAKKFMYPQHTDADGLAHPSPIRPT